MFYLCVSCIRVLALCLSLPPRLGDSASSFEPAHTYGSSPQHPSFPGLAAEECNRRFPRVRTTAPIKTGSGLFDGEYASIGPGDRRIAHPIAELVDNSQKAVRDAREAFVATVAKPQFEPLIEVVFLESKDSKHRHVLVADNGIGMDKAGVLDKL
jgi:hypothetical protein